jgi:hypothetical protein
LGQSWALTLVWFHCLKVVMSLRAIIAFAAQAAALESDDRIRMGIGRCDPVFRIILSGRRLFDRLASRSFRMGIHCDVYSFARKQKDSFFSCLLMVHLLANGVASCSASIFC